MYNHIGTVSFQKERYFILITGYFPKYKALAHDMAVLVPLPEIHKIHNLHV